MVGRREPCWSWAEKLYPYEIETLRYRFDLGARAWRRATSGGGPQGKRARRRPRRARARRRRPSPGRPGVRSSSSSSWPLQAHGLPRGRLRAPGGELRQRTYSVGAQQLRCSPTARSTAWPSQGLPLGDGAHEIESHVPGPTASLAVPWTAPALGADSALRPTTRSSTARATRRKLQAPHPVQSRMMAITNIFDALPPPTGLQERRCRPRPRSTSQEEAEIGQLDKDSTRSSRPPHLGDGCCPSAEPAAPPLPRPRHDDRLAEHLGRARRVVFFNRRRGVHRAPTSLPDFRSSTGR
jgi:hypothetical protein